MDQEYKNRAAKGYYRDLNNSKEASIERSYESSVEIPEDDEDLDEDNEDLLKNIDRNPTGNMLPRIVDTTTANNIRPTTVTTTYIKDPPKNNQ